MQQNLTQEVQQVLCILHITKLETTPINLANLSNVEKN